MCMNSKGSRKASTMSLPDIYHTATLGDNMFQVTHEEDQMLTPLGWSLIHVAFCQAIFKDKDGYL